MSTVVKSIDVGVPVSTAFQEWTRFEELPRFMRGVTEVRWLDERRLLWRASIGGVETKWALEVTDIQPEKIIAWSSHSGPRNRGAIEFAALGPAAARVTMTLHYDPASFFQNVTDYLGLVNRWVERSLVQFRDAMEQPSIGGLPGQDELVGQ